MLDTVPHITDPSCLFCKIVAKAIPAKIVYEDAHFLAFNDIHPKAPVHVLVIPKTHIPSLMELHNEYDIHLLGTLMKTLPIIAKQLGLQHGFKTVFHTGAEGGQEIYHIHAHILGSPKA